jgi:GNAT superfamily N-acetyltransferase
MISVHSLPDLSSIADLKADYLQKLIAPMDGMWDTGFTNPAPHWEIRVDGAQAGYYAENDEGTLLQFFVCPEFERLGQDLFNHVIARESVLEAVVSTIDPFFLSLCLDVHTTLKVHTCLYEVHKDVSPTHPEALGTSLRNIDASELDRVISFQQMCIGGEHDLSGWLRGYSSNLIAREELFVLSVGDEWIGIGECRKSDTQEGITDVGMMVAPDRRGNAWATYILTCLAERCRQRGQRAICSTTVENVGAQKAIMRSGFVSKHRIMTVTF